MSALPWEPNLRSWYLWRKTYALCRQTRAFGDDRRIVDIEVVHKDSPRDGDATH
jgi:hypothetical protein